MLSSSHRASLHFASRAMTSSTSSTRAKRRRWDSRTSSCRCERARGRGGGESVAVHGGNARRGAKTLPAVAVAVAVAVATRPIDGRVPEEPPFRRTRDAARATTRIASSRTGLPPLSSLKRLMSSISSGVAAAVAPSPSVRVDMTARARRGERIRPSQPEGRRGRSAGRKRDSFFPSARALSRTSATRSARRRRRATRDGRHRARRGRDPSRRRGAGRTRRGGRTRARSEGGVVNLNHATRRQIDRSCPRTSRCRTRARATDAGCPGTSRGTARSRGYAPSAAWADTSRSSAGRNS
eukprot:31542-Pelagococcus_subviridis.AAC.13